VSAADEPTALFRLFFVECAWRFIESFSWSENATIALDARRQRSCSVDATGARYVPMGGEGGNGDLIVSGV